MNHSRRTVLWALISQIKEWKIQSGECPGCFPRVHLALPHPLGPWALHCQRDHHLLSQAPACRHSGGFQFFPTASLKSHKWLDIQMSSLIFKRFLIPKYLVSLGRGGGALENSCTCRRYAVSPCCHFKGIRSLFSEELGISNIWNFKN